MGAQRGGFVRRNLRTRKIPEKPEKLGSPRNPRKRVPLEEIANTTADIEERPQERLNEEKHGGQDWRSPSPAEPAAELAPS